MSLLWTCEIVDDVQERRHLLNLVDNNLPDLWPTGNQFAKTLRPRLVDPLRLRVQQVHPNRVFPDATQPCGLARST